VTKNYCFDEKSCSDGTIIQRKVVVVNGLSLFFVDILGFFVAEQLSKSLRFL
jgi:hypothetical protein